MSDIFKDKEDYPTKPEKESQKKDISKNGPVEKQPEKETGKEAEAQQEIKQIKKEDEKKLSDLIKKELAGQTDRQAKQEVASSSSKEPSQIMKDGLKIVNKEETQRFYWQLVDLIKKILLKGQNNEPIEGKKIKEVIEKLVDQLTLGNSELIALIKNSTPDNYLYSHSVNVCILSVVLGLGLNYERKGLVELGAAAILHDIGMVRVCDISDKPSKLTDEEYKKIKEHPIFGVEMLGLSKDIGQAAIYVAREHHEWINGSGYPKGLKGEQINEYAKIVSTVDVYEALTHPRAHREGLLPTDAIRDILRNQVHFDPHFLKVLIEEVSIYPIGSWVELTSGEIAKVLKINKAYPLRPVVDIALDPEGQKVAEPKTVDLTKIPNLNIKKPIRENELKL